jgi:hypothetical protein
MNFSIRVARSPFRALSIAVILTAQLCAAVAQEPAASVRLTIDFGDGSQKTYSELRWKEKMTVFDALQAAEKHPRGIKFDYSGSGETIFIKAIDDATNEGEGGSNWRYRINDQPARYSAGVAELKVGDAVTWRFGK